jgi:hypothetical protein
VETVGIAEIPRSPVVSCLFSCLLYEVSRPIARVPSASLFRRQLEGFGRAKWAALAAWSGRLGVGDVVVLVVDGVVPVGARSNLPWVFNEFLGGEGKSG